MIDISNNLYMQMVVRTVDMHVAQNEPFAYALPFSPTLRQNRSNSSVNCRAPWMVLLFNSLEARLSYCSYLTLLFSPWLRQALQVQC